jgi:hypothetical protein
MRVLVSVLVSASLLAVGQAFLPPRGLTAPPIFADQVLEANLPVPPRIHDLLDHACNDCHSNNTRWPWYGKVLEGSVNRGRQMLNFSKWAVQGGQNPAVAVGKLIDACDAVKSRSMPPVWYVLLHPSATLSQSDIDAFCFWSTGQIHHIRARNSALHLTPPAL